jgi:hypothetical protein
MQSSKELAVILARLTALEFKFDEFAESIHTFLFSEEDYSPINRIHDKLDDIRRNMAKIEDFLQKQEKKSPKKRK